VRTTGFAVVGADAAASGRAPFSGAAAAPEVRAARFGFAPKGVATSGASAGAPMSGALAADKKSSRIPMCVNMVFWWSLRFRPMAAS